MPNSKYNKKPKVRRFFQPRLQTVRRIDGDSSRGSVVPVHGRLSQFTLVGNIKSLLKIGKVRETAMGSCSNLQLFFPLTLAWPMKTHNFNYFAPSVKITPTIIRRNIQGSTRCKNLLTCASFVAIFIISTDLEKWLFSIKDKVLWLLIILCS